MTDENINIVNMVEIDENNPLTRTDRNTYTSVIPLNKVKTGTTNTIKISIVWVDSETNSNQDINIGGTTSNPKLQIPITVKVSQYSGETITEYTEPGQ